MEMLSYCYFTKAFWYKIPEMSYNIAVNKFCVFTATHIAAIGYELLENIK
jgi:hypothetical protein